MASFVRVLAGDLKRAILSWRFLLGLTLGLLMLYQPAYPYSFYGGVHFHGITLLLGMQETLNMGAYVLCCVVLCALPYGDAHAWEVEGGAFPYLLRRAGTRRYAASKLAAAGLSGGLVIALPFLIFCLVQAFFLAPAPTPWEEWAVAGQETLALLNFGACWALSSLALSAFLPNPLVVLALPLCLTRFSWLLSAFTGLDIFDLSRSIGNISATVPMTFWEIAAQEGILSLIFIAIFAAGVARKKC